MIKKILKGIENRRKWNRDKRFLQDCTTSRLVVSLVNSGALKLPTAQRLWGRVKA